MKKILLLLVIGIAFIFAQNPAGDSIGRAKINYPLFGIKVADYVRDWTAPKMVWYWNAYTDTLDAGMVVVYDNAVVGNVDTCDISGAGSGTNDTLTIADSLDTNWWNRIYMRISSASNDTLIIQGLDENGTAQVETLACASGTDKHVYSVNYWTKLNLVFTTNGNDSLALNSLKYSCVNVTTDAGKTWVAGVVAQEGDIGAKTQIIVSGIAQTLLKGTNVIYPGAWITTTATAGYGVVEHYSSGFGVCLSAGNIDGAYSCYINPVASPILSGADVFTAQKTADTVLVPNALAGDIYLIQPLGTTPWTAAPTYSSVIGSLMVYTVDDDTAKARASGYDWYLIR